MSDFTLAIACHGERNFLLETHCELPARGITAICGPSGSGKTTLLDCIAGLRQPQAHSTIIFRNTTWNAQGTFVPPWQRGIGYVFSDARLFPHLSVRDNLHYAKTRQSALTVHSFDTVCDEFGVTPLLDMAPDTLSAGQRQRVAMARALLGGPGLLLLDEPFANLDSAATRHCQRVLKQLAVAQDLPMLYVSHNVEEVAQLADYLVFMRDGRIVDQGPLLELSGKLNTQLSRDEDAAAIVEAIVGQHDAAFALTELHLEGQPLQVKLLAAAPGTAYRVRIPARDVSISRTRAEDTSILNILPVEVAGIAAVDNARVMLQLRIGQQVILARITRKSAATLSLAIGDKVFAQIKSAALLSASAATL